MDHGKGDCWENAIKGCRSECTTKPLHPQEAVEAKTPSKAKIKNSSQTTYQHRPIQLEHENQEKTQTGGHPSITREIDSNSSRAVIPRHNDVLLGRGRRFHTSEGNMRMWRIISHHKSEYDAKHKAERHSFVETVLDEILEGDTRFLRRIESRKEEEEQWEEVGRTVALSKIWHAIRSKGKKSTRQNHQNCDDINQEKNAGKDEHPAKKAATVTTSGSKTQPIQTTSTAPSSTAGFLHPSANLFFGAASASSPHVLSSLLAADQHVLSRPGDAFLARTPFSLSPYEIRSFLSKLKPYGLPGVTREGARGLPRNASLVGIGGHQPGFLSHPDQRNLLLRLREVESMKLQALRSYLMEARRQQSERENG